MNDIVEMIREKTEEENLDQILKSNMGGYTKKSVREYLAQVKRQQQTMAENFRKDLQSMLEEKEALQQDLEAARNRLEKKESDYRILNDTVTALRGSNSGASAAEELLQLKSEYALLEKDMDEALVRIQSDEQKLNHRDTELAQRTRELEQKDQQVQLLQEQLMAARNESVELNRTVSAQSASITRLQDEVAYLKGIVSDGNVSKLNGQIDSLMENVRTQQELIEAKEQELSSSKCRAELLNDQNEEHRRMIAQMQMTLEAQQLRCEKLEASAEMLSEQLQEALHLRMELLRAQSALRVEKAVLARKLDTLQLQREMGDMLQDSVQQGEAAEEE